MTGDGVVRPRRDAYDVVVIGSGAGGTAAGALLAKAGLRVLIVEQWRAPGGYAHSFQNGPYTIDPAVHISGDPGLFDALLRHLDVRDRCTFLFPELLYVAHLPGLTVRLPIRSTDEFVDAHVAAFPGSAAGIRRLFELCGTIHREAHELPAALALDRLTDATERFPTLFAYRRSTVGEVLEEVVPDQRARALCGVSCDILGLPPSRLPFQLFSQFLMSYLVEGGFFAEGGAQRLIDALLEGFSQAGGELLLETLATKIVVENGRVRAVELGGERVNARLVISNASALQTFGQLVGAEHLPPGFLRRLERLTVSGSGAMLFGATTSDAAAAGLDHNNILAPIWDIDESHRRTEDGEPGGALHLRVPSTVDAALAPPGEHVFELLAPRRYATGAAWEAEGPRFAAQLLDELRTRLPAFEAGLVFSDSATPLTLERFTLNTRGAIYGWENSLRHIGRARPAQRTPVSGLVLAGHWTTPGPGFLRATVSGIHAAQLVLAETGTDAAPFEYASLPPVAGLANR